MWDMKGARKKGSGLNPWVVGKYEEEWISRSAV